MKDASVCLIGLVFVVSVSAEPLLEGQVRLESGEPVADAQVRLFDMTDLRQGAIARAMTDGTGYFALPLAALGGRALPARFALRPNYPNPFNPSTIIPYQLAASSAVRLEVFNLLGQRITTLVDGERPAGFHTATWHATDGAGRAVAAGVYLYRMTVGEERQTGRMVLIDGQAGRPTAGSGGSAAAVEAAGAAAPVYGLTVSGPGLVSYVNPAFRVEADRGSVDLVVETLDSTPRAKGAATGILGDVDNNAQVDIFDALLVALYSEDTSLVLPNHGAISLGDVNADGQVDRADAWLISAYSNDPSDPTLPAGLGKRVSSATASLSPDPSTVAFADDGIWHRFTVQASEPVSVVVNPGATSPRLELTTRSGRDNYCPGSADDAVSREDGEAIYLAGCASGTATVELRRESDDTVLQTYTFTVSASPADLVVSASVSASSLTSGQSFTLSATVRNQGTASASATTLRYYRSSNRTISWQDTQIGSDAVSALAASATSAASISLTAPSTPGTYYYGACVERKSGESAGNNCSTGIRVIVEGDEGDEGDLIVSASVNDNILTTEQAFILRARVQNQETDESPELVLSYYRSSNATITTRDTQVGTDEVGSLAASSIRNESIRLTAPSTPGTYHYGACVASVSDESDTPSNCSSGVRVIVEEDDTPEEELASPPATLGLDPFYEKYLNAEGLPIVASSKVPDAALFQVRDIVDEMLALRADLWATLVDLDIRVAIMAASSVLTDLPEFSHFTEFSPGVSWDERTRGGGVGPTTERPVMVIAEENLLCYGSDVFPNEDIFVHEFAHAVLNMGVERQSGGKEFRRRLEAAYGEALEAGLWKWTYAATNPDEYWAEGVQSWFGLNDPPGSIHNDIDTRSELEVYDPALAGLILEVFGEVNVSVSCHETVVEDSKSFRIRGVVVGQDDQPLERIGLWAWQGDVDNSGYGTTGSDGAFDIRVPAGSFTLDIYARGECGFVGWYDGNGLTSHRSQAFIVEVAGQNIDGIVIKLPGPPDELPRIAWCADG